MICKLCKNNNNCVSIFWIFKHIDPALHYIKLYFKFYCFSKRLFKYWYGRNSLLCTHDSVKNLTTCFKNKTYLSKLKDTQNMEVVNFSWSSSRKLFVCWASKCDVIKCSATSGEPETLLSPSRNVFCLDSKVKIHIKI